MTATRSCAFLLYSHQLIDSASATRVESLAALLLVTGPVQLGIETPDRVYHILRLRLPRCLLPLLLRTL